MKKVLIALDYDPTAQKVAETGFAVAKSMGAQVILLHVISEPVYYSSTEYSPIMGFGGYFISGASELSSEETLKESSLDFLAKTRSHLGDESIQTLVKEGEFAETILKTAKQNQADMIIMGSHSRKWLDNIIMGSVTGKVLNHSDIPLLIIPTGQAK
ncbi:MAG: universal stress protein [Bacteroidota bacterium]